MRDAFAGWLKVQVSDVIRLARRLLGSRAEGMDNLLDAIDLYYSDLASHMPDDVLRAVDSVSRSAYEKVKVRVPESDAPSLDWYRSYLEQYYADMDKRLCKANHDEIARIVNKADDPDILDVLKDRLGNWGTERAETMARFEAMLAANSVIVEGFKQAGYTSVWVATTGECPACKALHGQTVSTLRPPLHKGCMCTVDVGEKANTGLPLDGEGGILNALTNDGGVDVHTVGAIDVEKLNGHWGEVKTTTVLTNERIEHIRENHADDFDKYSSYIFDVITSPKYVLDDTRNELTAMYIKRIDDWHVKAVVKFARDDDDPSKCNSILTLHRIRERELKRELLKYPVVYKDG